MEEKKGLLSALAETLRQFELNQTEDKESLAIAMEEKLEEIAKMISSLSDRVDNLSSRVNHIGDKVDTLTATNVEVEKEVEPTSEPVFDEKEEAQEEEDTQTAEPVFDAESIDNQFHMVEDEDPDLDDMELESVDDEIDRAEEEIDEAEEDVEEVPEEEVETAEDEEEEEPEPVKEEVAKPVSEDGKKADWYDWEYDYPADYVDDLLESMGINDKLEFVRELFHSDPLMFDSQMKEIDTMPNFKAIVQFFRMAHPEWDEGSDTVYRLYMHIRRKFRN